MEYHFTYNPSASELSDSVDFLREHPSSPPDQDWNWNKLLNPGKRALMFYGMEDGEMKTYTLVQESNLAAKVFLGPICTNKDALLEAVEELRAYYRKLKFASLIIQLDHLNSEQEGGKELICEKYDCQDTSHLVSWASIKIDISGSLEEIRGQYRKRHKQSLKKADTSELRIRPLEDKDEVEKFAEIYDEMYRHRSIRKDFDDSKAVFKGLWGKVRNEYEGYFLGVFDSKSNMLGGIFSASFNRTSYYRFGATSPEARSLPINHIGIDECIRRAKEKGCLTYDLWGYNPKAHEGDQVSKINLFKAGFGGELVEYPEIIHIKLYPISFYLLSILKRIKKLVG